MSALALKAPTKDDLSSSFTKRNFFLGLSVVDTSSLLYETASSNEVDDRQAKSSGGTECNRHNVTERKANECTVNRPAGTCIGLAIANESRYFSLARQKDLVVTATVKNAAPCEGFPDCWHSNNKKYLLDYYFIQESRIMFGPEQ
uniref:Uncharacterized protein n=1 Tax=Romanomermis culicivorax TaxID=13658 RepID=A0A915KB61_ROMCU